MATPTWDYIVIGAGSAGCAVAHELASAGRKARILVIEAGGSDRSALIRIPAGQLKAIARHDWGYRSEPDPTRNGLSERWERGRVVGGSSSINGTMYVRGAVRDFDRWSDECESAAWSSGAIMPLFREMETFGGAADAFRGVTGPLHVRRVQRPHAITRAFVESAVACGYGFNPDYNGAAQEGVSYAQLSQRKGFRCSAADAFLRPAIRSGKVTLRLNTEVRKLELSRGRATGVRVVTNGTEQIETADKVILCAGAINSPKLLMLSGIGDPDELERHNIPVKVGLSGVGRNLRDHPLVKLVYRTTVPTYNPTEGPLQKLGIAFKYVLAHEGPISNIFEATAFLRSSPSAQHPDIQLHFVAAGYAATASGFTLAPYSSVTVLLNASYPKSSGRVRIRSANPADMPLIECRLLEDEADIDVLIQGTRIVRRIMRSEPISDLVAEEIAPSADLESDSQLREFVRAHAGIAYHPLGTCKMGPGPDAVVGPDLRLRGAANIWVADASVIPGPISGNTNAACMMIGMKLGRELR